MTKNVLVKFSGATTCLHLDASNVTAASLFQAIENALQIPAESQRVTLDGSPVGQEDSLLLSHDFHLVEVSGRLLGGKGGFGSLLRGQKGARKKITNFDACRNLSGRRLRHARVAERIQAWMKRKKASEELVAALGGESAKTKPNTLVEPKLEEEYFDQLENLAKDAALAVQEGLQRLVQEGRCNRSASSSTTLPENETSRPAGARLLLCDDRCGLSDDESSDDDMPIEGFGENSLQVAELKGV